MKKTFLFLMVVGLFLTTSSSLHAALNFRMTIDKPVIGINETALIELYAHSEEAGDMNGLNNWQLGLIVTGTGEVEVVTDSVEIELFTPFDISVADSGYENINSPNGSIEDLTMQSDIPGTSTTFCVEGYDKIAEFEVRGIIAGEVEYMIGDYDGGFFGILRDFTPPFDPDNYFDGTFDIASSDTQITVVPEPASLALLGGMSFFLLRRRNTDRIK